jgi:predicted dehydrogenase
MTDPIRVAVLGNGFARHVVFPCLRRVEGIVLAGIASPNLARAQETAAAFGVDGAWADHRDLLAHAGANLVFIATPPHRHAEMAIDSLRAGCHVVCEKPTALDAGESGRMLAAARAASGRIAIIDHELRFHPGRIALRRLVKQGKLGEILRASYLLHSPARRDPALPWSWWCDLAQGGGALGAIGSHAVDALRVLLGSEVVEVRGFLHTFTGERRDLASGSMRPVTSDELVSAWLRFASGSLAEISISMVDGPRLHRIQIAGAEGTASIDEQAPLRIECGPGGPMEEPIPWGLPSAAELAIPDTDWARSFLLLARRVAAAIRMNGASVDGAATFEDGHRNQLVLDAIRRSAGGGSWIAVPSA